jgi:hypothetical protein
MGSEARCRVELDGAVFEDAKALLETEELIVRGPARAKVPFSEVRQITAARGILHVRWSGHDLRLHLGHDAIKWAAKISRPKSVVEKLGIKSSQRVSICGRLPEGFLAELERVGADLSRRVRKASDVIFLAAETRNELARLQTLKGSLVPNGAIWVIRPKGVTAISESDVMASGKAAGLVDVKVVRVSATHTGEKLVIPVSKR